MCTTSTSFMTCAGLKKCMPMTSCGREVTLAQSMIGSDEVVVARIARLADPVEVTEEVLLDGEVLGDRLDDEVDVAERLTRGRAGDPPEQRLGVLGVIRPFSTAQAPLRASAARTASTLSSPRATNVTAYPALANTSMIPVAIVPDPTTPTDATGRSATPAGGRRGRLRVRDDLRRTRLGVGVEAAPALAAEHPGAHHLLDDRARGVQPVAALLVHRVEDLVGRVETDEVEQRERTHGVAAPEAHRRVEVLPRGVTALEHRHGVVEVAEEQGVGDEAALSPTTPASCRAARRAP